jgi:ribosomal protein S18 acetylase RimI-like enzyme
MDIITENRAEFAVSYIDPNVIYIHSSIFESIPKTVNHVKKSHSECDFELVRLTQQIPPNTTLVIYLNNNHRYKLTRKILEKDLYKDILGFLTVELYKDHAEVYNVCTAKASRGKGIMTKIFESMLVEIPKEKIWLGIKLDNPMFEKVLRLYVSVGFKVSGIQHITPSNIIPNFAFLSLDFTKGTSIMQQQDEIYVEVEKGTRMRDEYKNGGKCTINTYIKPELITDIQDKYMMESVEYGGIMASTRMKNGTYLLGLAAETRGSKNFKTDIPPYYINWHTHPFICYAKNRCHIGWPSGQDMGYIFRKYVKGVIAHILFAKEGVYFIQLSPAMMSYVRILNSSCIDDIANVIAYFYSNLEVYRKAEHDLDRLRCLDETNDLFDCLTYSSGQRDVFISNIVKTMNETTLSYLLNTVTKFRVVNEYIERSKKCIDDLANKTTLIPPNFPIFRSIFIPIEQAQTRGVEITIQYLMAPNHSACVIPDYNNGKVQYGESIWRMDGTDNIDINLNDWNATVQPKWETFGW